jgi:hypothetical protein
MGVGTEVLLKVIVTALPLTILPGDTVTVDKDTSSLVMVTVAELGEPTVYAALALNVTTTVSSFSAAVSLMGVTVIVFDADPAGIVTLVPILL